MSRMDAREREWADEDSWFERTDYPLNPAVAVEGRLLAAKRALMAARAILREIPDDELGAISNRFDDAWQEIEFGFVGVSDHVTQRTARGACYCEVCDREVTPGNVRCPVHEDD